MKTLFLVRHAKSDWGDEDLSDIDRPLNKRGYRDAHFMSNLMKERYLIPDLIITSPAIRAISTALIFGRNLKLNYSNLIINPNLYGTSMQHYKDCIAKTDDQHKNVMLFGHNSIISELANSLAKPFTENIATCGIVGIRPAENCNEWKCFIDTAGELLFYDFPKNHTEKH